jgi:hypothetical protein
MKEIKLTRGYATQVDDEDYERMAAHNWCACVTKWGCNYAQRSTTKAERASGFPMAVQMHRQIMGFPKGCEIDHRDRNGLNNQKGNLRLCTRQQNRCNTRNTIGRSGHRGVNRVGKKWRARVYSCGKAKGIGYFDSLQEAVAARDAAVKKYHGEFAYAE